MAKEVVYSVSFETKNTDPWDFDHSTLGAKELRTDLKEQFPFAKKIKITKVAN